MKPGNTVPLSRPLLRWQYRRFRSLWSAEEVDSMVNGVRSDLSAEFGVVEDDAPPLGPDGLRLAPGWRESVRYRGEEEK